MIAILGFIIATITSVAYYVFAQGLWVVVGLFVLTLATRFNRKMVDFGRLLEILFVFFLIAFVIFKLDAITYPYSLILILTALVALIFLEGPEWSKLYFSPGKTRTFLRQALIIALSTSVVFGAWIFFRMPPQKNPVPVNWPIDALIVAGIGFALYLAIMEEIIFRSFIFQRAKSAAGTKWAMPIQGTVYGLMHYRAGVPNGWEGVILAGLYGVGLGYLVKKSDSIYLSMLVNFLVTLVIFIELILIGKFKLSHEF